MTGKTERDGNWLPISQADRTIVHQQHFPSVGLTIRNSDRYWVRDEDGRVYEASWTEGENGRNYWWDWDNESPVDPVEFCPHPCDPRFPAVSVNERSTLLALVQEMGKALEAAKKRMRNCRGAIESNQVVDKDVHGSLKIGMADIDAALASFTAFMEGQDNALRALSAQEDGK